MPRKEDWLSIKNRISKEYEHVKLLTRIDVDIDIKTGTVSFELPDYGLTNKETIIEDTVWDNVKDELVRSSEIWGIVELGYRPPDDSAKPKIPGKIKLTDFTSFTPYSVDLAFYKDVRSDFSTEEWIDVLLGAMDYNPSGYEDEYEKISMLQRLLTIHPYELLTLSLHKSGKSIQNHILSNCHNSPFPDFHHI